MEIMSGFYSGRNITISESGHEESMGMSEKKSAYAQLEDKEWKKHSLQPEDGGTDMDKQHMRALLQLW